MKKRKVDAEQAQTNLNNRWKVVERYLAIVNKEIKPLKCVRVGIINQKEDIVLDIKTDCGAVSFRFKGSDTLNCCANGQGLIANFEYYCGYFDAYKALFGFVCRFKDGTHEVETYDGK